MQPPWTAFPEIPQGSIGWRMGEGEGYYNRFYRWYSALSPEAQADFSREHPAPGDWSELYVTIQRNPWV